jgi:hypothetical protein
MDCLYDLRVIGFNMSTAGEITIIYYCICNIKLPNVVVESLIFLLRVLLVSGSNLGPEIRYPD